MVMRGIALMLRLTEPQHMSLFSRSIQFFEWKKCPYTTISVNVNLMGICRTLIGHPNPCHNGPFYDTLTERITGYDIVIS
jgi:hypothetical protein